MKPTRPRVRPGALASTLLLVLPSVGRAAVPDLSSSSWLAGAAHPVIEYTHLSALALLGVAAALLGGRSFWGLPLMVVVLMAFGVVLGTQGAVVPMLDTIVLTTALCLTLLILGRVRLTFAIVASAAGAFALFHGVADGILMDVGGVDGPYAISFAAANLLILGASVFAGEWLRHSHAAWIEHVRHWHDHTHGVPGT